MKRTIKHRTLFLFFILIFAMMYLACKPNPRDLQITEKNKDSFFEQIKDSKEFTVEETRLLLAYKMRAELGQAFGASDLSLIGKTVGEIIEEEREFETNAKAEAKKQDALAQEAKAREEALAQRLREVIQLSMYEKSFVPMNWRAGIHDDYITFEAVYRNVSDQDVRAFRGIVRFKDLFGEPIKDVRLTISDPVHAGAKAEWSGTLEFNQFIDSDVKLKNTTLEDMQVEWVPQAVIFADGTKLGNFDQE